MKAYFSVFRMRWKMEVQYRGAVLGGVICQMFFGLILVALYRALYAGKPQSMPLSSVTAYVWLQQAFFRMLLSSDDELLDKIRTGNIAYDLCRPLQLYGYYYVRVMAQKLLGSLLRATPMLVFAMLLPAGWGIQGPVSGPAFLLAVMGLLLGLLCVCALENITMGFTMRPHPGGAVRMDAAAHRPGPAAVAAEPEAACDSGRVSHGHDQIIFPFHGDAAEKPIAVPCLLLYADLGPAGDGSRGNAGGDPDCGSV